jgi:hypothetical protein
VEQLYQWIADVNVVHGLSREVVGIDVEPTDG